MVKKGDAREALRGAEEPRKQEPCTCAGCLCKKCRKQLYISRRLRGVPKRAQCRAKRDRLPEGCRKALPKKYNAQSNKRRNYLKRFSEV